MDIIAILTILIVLIIILELAKHQISKFIVTSLVVGIIFMFVMFFVTSNLELESHLDSDNPILSTGASVLLTAQNSEIGESLSELITNLKEKITGKDEF